MIFQKLFRNTIQHPGMKNNYLIELSGENLEIGRSEIKNIEEAYGDFQIKRYYNNIAVVEGDYKHLQEAAFVNYISEILVNGNSYNDLNFKIPEGKFYVRVAGTDKKETENIESNIGEMLGGHGRISFENPDFILRAVKSDTWYLCLLKYQRNKKYFEARRAPLRPFFSPVSLHPKYARYLVNTSGTVPGDTVLDPFCGTGGILIEASMLGRHIIGNDYSLNMVMGTRLNFKYYKIENYEIYNSDIEKLELKNSVDSITTDMPYGRSSGIANHEINELYKESFKKFFNLLKDGGRCSIIINNKDYIKYSEPYFKLIADVPVYQHKSLTREFIILEKL